MITVLAGGVGAARFLRGLIQVVEPREITAIVNTADDFVLHGLNICPDLDTVRYTLADDIGEHGWGRSGESWSAMAAIKHYAEQAPDNSRATDWFNLGDRDLATHLYRTQRLREGADLTEVTMELCRASGVAVELIPMTHDPVATLLTLTTGEVIDFQEYFVQRRHSVAVSAVTFENSINAKPSRRALEAIDDAARVIIAPSNPLLSIGPIFAMAEIAAAVRAKRSQTVAISPIISGKAVKGPADRLLVELGADASVGGVAALWNQYAAHLVIDDDDRDQSASITQQGMQAVITPTLMTDLDKAKALARTVVSLALD